MKPNSMLIAATRALAIAALLLPALIANGAQDQTDGPPLPLVQEGKTLRLAERVYVIPDGRVNLVPNIGIIVGDRATMIVDTGMGPRNSEAVLREVAKVSHNSELYLTITHFHPEHGMGAQAFPTSTRVMYPATQREELHAKARKFIELFSGMSPGISSLLKDVTIRPADIVFDAETEVDLGGITVRLMYLGPAHTRGDNFVLLPAEGILFAGDVVLNRFFPIMPDADANGQNWIKILDELDKLKPLKVVPGHGEVGDAGLIGEMRKYLTELRTRVLELKGKGDTKETIGKALTDEFRSRYGDWDNSMWIRFAADRFYSEAP